MWPIAGSDTWSHFAGFCVLRTYGRGVGARLAPLQVGIGISGGTEAVAHMYTQCVHACVGAC